MQAGLGFFFQDGKGTAFGQGTVSACAGPKERAAIIIKQWLLQGRWRGSAEDTAEDVLEIVWVATSSPERTAALGRGCGLEGVPKN